MGLQKVLVSSCLMGNRVRYNGGALSISDAYHQWLSGRCEIVSFCPEVAAGLTTPRTPAEIITGSGDDVLAGMSKVLDKDGHDVTKEFVTGAHLALALCENEGIRFAVFAEESPSCGSRRIYDGSFSGVKKTGKGVTATLLEQHGVKVFSQQTIGELKRILKI